MNQIKIGAFLKNLRKEKGLTQAQLAEQFGVSSRTVSRWETGNNLPDLSLLVELADYYDIDIREIINGERKSENMNQEEKETLQMVAKYAEEEKDALLKTVRIISIVGTISLLVYCMMNCIMDFRLAHLNIPVLDFITGCSFGLAFGALLTTVLYTTGILAKIRNQKHETKSMKYIAIACVCISIALFIASIIASL